MVHRDVDALKIVRDALDTDLGERERYVESRCSGDPELQARVRSMLKRIRGDEWQDDERIVGDWNGSDTPSLEFRDPEDALIGTQLGPYCVVERVGRGGMGIVYRGLREGADFAQEVAIKLIRRGYDFDDVHARFLRERRILARLSHPNLARFIDGGVAAGGRPWFALEFVSGEPITSWCDHHRLSVRARLELLLDVCAAVQYAHTRLVVHRDLKPGNVLIDESGTARLLDFGVAGILAGDIDDDDLPSTFGSPHAMTPEYAAPEQFAGAAAGVPADVYSLGVLAYELITGVLPYSIDRNDRASAAQLAATVPPQPLANAISRPIDGQSDAAQQSRLSARKIGLAVYRRLVRGDLGRIIDKALAKEPERRYATAQSFADDLSRWLAGAPVRVTGNGFGYRFGKFVQRNRVAVGLATLAFALLIAGGAGVIWKSREALQEAERATAVKIFVLSLFDSNTPGGATDTVPSTRDLLKRGVERVQTEMKDQPGLRADMLTTLGRIHNQLSLYDEADPLLRQALELEDSAGGVSAINRATTLRELAQGMYERQRHPEAIALLDQALPLVASNRDATEAGIRQLLGVALAADHQAERGLRESVDAVALWREVQRPPGDKVANALGDYANALQLAGKVEQSLEPNREALKIFKQLHGGIHADVALVESNMGVSLMMLGRFEDALVPLREAVEVDRKVYGSTHRALAVHLSNLGSAQIGVGHLDDAINTLRESAAVRTALYGADSPETAKTQINLSAALRQQENYAEVDEVLRSAVAALDKAEGDWRRWISIAENNRALALTQLGRTDEAQQAINRAIAVRSEFDTDPNSKAMHDMQSVIADIEVREGRLDLAEALCQKLLDSSLANLPTNAAGLPDRYMQLASVELLLKKYENAKANFEEGVRLEAERAGGESPSMIRGRLGLVETLNALRDRPAAREQLILVKAAIDALPTAHSQHKRFAELEESLSE
ncbi:MAG: serine/threonine-protein kinase [Dokdonella sp.]